MRQSMGRNYKLTMRHDGTPRQKRICATQDGRQLNALTLQLTVQRSGPAIQLPCTFLQTHR